METKEAQVLAAARDALIKMAYQRDAAENKVGHLEGKLAMVHTRLECEKTAAEMHEKGLNIDQEFSELVNDLEKSASEGRLPIIQEAVRMSAPNMGTKIASISNDETSSETGNNQLEQYLVGSVG